MDRNILYDYWQNKVNYILKAQKNQKIKFLNYPHYVKEIFKTKTKSYLTLHLQNQKYPRTKVILILVKSLKIGPKKAAEKFTFPPCCYGLTDGRTDVVNYRVVLLLKRLIIFTFACWRSLARVSWKIQQELNFHI